MVITFCNGKGGVGKSTLSVLTTLLLDGSGQSTGLIDRDPQATATFWLQTVGKEQARPDANHAHWIIDTPPDLRSPLFTESIRQADRIVVVCSPSPADLWTTKDSIAAINAIKQPDAKVLLLFNRAKSNTTLTKGIDELVAKLGGKRIPQIITDRQAFQHAALYGIEGLSGEALQELAEAVKSILA